MAERGGGVPAPQQRQQTKSTTATKRRPSGSITTTFTYKLVQF